MPMLLNSLALPLDSSRMCSQLQRSHTPQQVIRLQERQVLMQHRCKGMASDRSGSEMRQGQSGIARAGRHGAGPVTTNSGGGVITKAALGGMVGGGLRGKKGG